MSAFNLQSPDVEVLTPEEAEVIDQVNAADDAWSFNGYLRFTPVLWAIGVLIPSAVLMLLQLVITRWPKGRLINFIIMSWMSIAVAQAICSILNGILLHQATTGLRNTISFTVIGWVFGAIAIAAGNAWQLANRKAAYLTACLGGYILILALIALIAHLAGFRQLSMMTPTGLLLPGSNAINFYATMTIFQSEETLGEARTRLILFFPWAPALGLGALGIALISTRVQQMKWRFIGMLGGVVGVIFSWSRLAIAALLLISGIMIFLKSPKYLQVLGTTLVAVVIYGMSVIGLDPITLVKDMHEAADQARVGSSIARDLIYEKSWQGFLQSPWIGNGWIGESVHPIEILPIGSHSTIYGLLYTGGSITFVCYAIAVVATLYGIGAGITRAMGNPVRRDDAIVALGIWISLMFYSPYESLFSLTIPCLFILTWIGGVIPADEPRSALRWLRKVQGIQKNVFYHAHHPVRQRSFGDVVPRKSSQKPREPKVTMASVTAFTQVERDKGKTDDDEHVDRGRENRAFRTNAEHRHSSL